VNYERDFLLPFGKGKESKIMSLSKTELYPQFLVLIYSAEKSGRLVELLEVGLAPNFSDAVSGIEYRKLHFSEVLASRGLLLKVRLYHLTRAKI
jgi:hypothetical protein